MIIDNSRLSNFSLVSVNVYGLLLGIRFQHIFKKEYEISSFCFIQFIFVMQ
jgi:hypothetical protein